MDSKQYAQAMAQKLAEDYAKQVNAPEAIPEWVTTFLDILLYVFKFLMVFAPFLILAELKDPGPWLTHVLQRKINQSNLRLDVSEAVIKQAWHSANDEYVAQMTAAAKEW